MDDDFTGVNDEGILGVEDEQTPGVDEDFQTTGVDDTSNGANVDDDAEDS